MVIHELKQEDCIALLRKATIARLGCSVHDQPYVVPVFVAYENEHLYVFATYGKKIEWMRENPKVCVQVDDVSSPTEWTSVLVNGTYQELAEPQFTEERAHARQVLESRHDWWLNAVAERRLTTSDVAVTPIFFRIRITEIHGIGSAK
jgi:nitroimidazol reductase NimA-like FMN-containing flavoprotein (pyridoxamine 5'-phosphate oxidase superfamily)